jgi:hypothetical protein
LAEASEKPGGRHAGYPGLARENEEVAGHSPAIPVLDLTAAAPDSEQPWLEE